MDKLHPVPVPRRYLVGFDPRELPHHFTDVLVIGGGIAGFRAALLGPGAWHTVMTSAISGRPARCLANRFTALGDAVDVRTIPAYPIAYDAGKALHAAARAAGESGYGAQWAGQGAPLARSLPAATLVAVQYQAERAVFFSRETAREAVDPPQFLWPVASSVAPLRW